MGRIGQIPRAATLRESLSYEPETGLFRWLKSGFGTKAGDIAGTLSPHNYILICVRGRRYMAHRLAWQITHDDLTPEFEIDHKDSDRSNNRIANLRKATHSQQQQNKAARRDSSTGLKGAIYNPRRGRRKHWHSQIIVAGKSMHLGWFMTPEEAHAAYMAAARELHGEFLREP